MTRRLLDPEGTKVAKIVPANGKWQLRSERFMDGKTLDHWYVYYVQAWNYLHLHN